MNFDYKNILIGFFIGLICTIITFLLIGEVEIETDFQFGDKAKNKDISLIINKDIGQDGKEMISIDAIGGDGVTLNDIESQLEKLYIDKNIYTIDIKANITLDEEIDFEQ